MQAADRTGAQEPALFAALEEQPPDGLLMLIGQFRRDPRPSKIDLGVGVYRDERGETPVMAAVKEAERRLHETQATKAYLAPEGDARFAELLLQLLAGPERAADPRLTGVQTTGGTGALRMAAELAARAHPQATVWIGHPTWPNHEPIFRAAGLRVALHPFFDQARQTVEFEAMTAALETARPRDLVLLHGSCHNPSGAEFTPDQWRAIAELLVRRGLVPLLDVAYQGMGAGLEADAAGARLCLEHVPEAMVAYSCDKNFGLYRDRTGALFVQAADAETARRARTNMLSLARASYSMPPDHGAALVRIVLESDELAALWREELEAIRRRMAELRQRIAAIHPRLAPFAGQAGMFSLLPVEPAAVERLRERYGIYMAASGRINVAGIRAEAIPALAAALAEEL